MSNHQPPDGTELNASERDLLFSVAGSLEGPGAPTVAEVRNIAIQSSERFSKESTGNLYLTLEKLEEKGLVTRGEDGTDGRTTIIGLTMDGEQVLEDLYERSQEAMPEDDG